ncbi:MAG TPA: YggS family pyridoxal phosphate-dependent enzyme [Steroidobacteraceae bacterium]|nr:YggS family pyridoxal phosphate-dependent enzyme [Steroidobacteraceae bacterium]
MLRVPQNLPENLRAVRERVAAAAARAGRSVDCVTIIAATKAQPPIVVRQAAQAGLTHFGESYLQEAAGKMPALADLPLTWHFIGQVQANKTRAVAEAFAWVHSIDRLRLAERLDAQRPADAPRLNVCLQVNIGAEASKGGVAPRDLPALASAVARLPRLALRGLMCVPPPQTDPARQRAAFAQLHDLFETLNHAGAGLDTLSMGMSADFEAAILEGATFVRIGTALFGERPSRDQIQSRRGHS